MAERQAAGELLEGGASAVQGVGARMIQQGMSVSAAALRGIVTHYAEARRKKAACPIQSVEEIPRQNDTVVFSRISMLCGIWVFFGNKRFQVPDE